MATTTPTGPVLPATRTNGGYFSSRYGIDAVWSKIALAVQTPTGTRFMRRSFGCPLSELLYGPLDSATIQQAEYYVRDTIGRFVPEARILEVSVTRPAANTVRLVVSFDVPSLGESASRSLSFTPDQLAI